VPLLFYTERDAHDRAIIRVQPDVYCMLILPAFAGAASPTPPINIKDAFRRLVEALRWHFGWHTAPNGRERHTNEALFRAVTSESGFETGAVPEMRGSVAKNRGRIGPYSAVLQRGVIGDTVDGPSRDGRLARHIAAELIKHLGGNMLFVEKLLIERFIKTRLRLEALEEKGESGEWTDLDRRTYAALLNAFRLTAREIGLNPAATPPPTFFGHIHGSIATSCFRRPGEAGHLAHSAAMTASGEPIEAGSGNVTMLPWGPTGPVQRKHPAEAGNSSCFSCGCPSGPAVDTVPDAS
jgi:hypothetical protein